ncbi:dUTPase-like domain-containing protein [Plasmodiophora brassicae]
MLAASVTARAAALRRRLFVSSPRWTIRRTMSGVVVDCDTGAMIQANGDDRVDVDKDVVAPQSLLSDAALMEHMARGTVVIEPFIPENLSTSSYDVTLGEYYFREATPEPGDGIFNPYSEAMVRRVWGANDLQRAERAGLWMDRTNLKLENVHRDDQLIWIRPGETILGHTNEFIGGRRTVTTMMKARSSLGRNFIEVCKCAGWGDIGYVNRWTMEITNNSRHYSIPLVVGRRIAQIVFFDTQGTLNGRSYSNNGKYQTADTLEALKQKWSPFEMSSSRLGALPERVDQRASSAPFDDRTDKGTGHDRPVKSARRPEHEIVTAAR